MKLSSLIEGLSCKVVAGSLNKEINELIYCSKKAADGTAFFAIPGAETDGNLYIAEAVRKGACAVFVEKPYKVDYNGQFTVIETESVRKTLALLAKRFYGNPCDSLVTIGVTGTKGKTSTSFMIKSILECAGIKTGIIGTVYNGCENHYEEADRTTPQSVDIYRLCADMKDYGCKAVVIEVSSQGLMQDRVEGISFDVGVFTNFSLDHIGPYEHSDEADYFFWKKQLFYRCKYAVINGDDKKSDEIVEIMKKFGKKNIIFGKKRFLDCIISDLKLLKSDNWVGIEYTMQGEKIFLKSPGQFNAYNSAAAAMVGRLLGCSWEHIKSGLEEVRIPGRCEIVNAGLDFTVMVDYAHNGKSLEELLTSLRQYNPNKLRVVFGCGGNRDKARRAEMGRAAALFADFSVITSDNPRWEDPLKIIENIVDAVKVQGGSFVSIPDRGEAIEWALRNSEREDIVVVAGKGHETYQIIGNEKRHFDDKEFILKMSRG